MSMLLVLFLDCHERNGYEIVTSIDREQHTLTWLAFSPCFLNYTLIICSSQLSTDASCTKASSDQPITIQADKQG